MRSIYSIFIISTAPGYVLASHMIQIATLSRINKEHPRRTRTTNTSYRTAAILYALETIANAAKQTLDDSDTAQGKLCGFKLQMTLLSSQGLNSPQHHHSEEQGPSETH